MKTKSIILAAISVVLLASACARQHTCPTYLKVKNVNADRRV